MAELAEKHRVIILKPKKKDSIVLRALNQAARELVLAQLSDWAFIMKTGTMVPYAHRRSKVHINRFTRLYNDILSKSIDNAWLKEVESRDNIFKDMICAEYYLNDFKPMPITVAAKSKGYKVKKSNGHKVTRPVKRKSCHSRTLLSGIQ